jgi:hypothetical protein
MASSSDQLKLLLRQGDPLSVRQGAKQVKSFTVLFPAGGAEGPARGLSPSGNFAVAHVEFTDRTHAIVKLAAP